MKILIEESVLRQALECVGYAGDAARSQYALDLVLATGKALRSALDDADEVEAREALAKVGADTTGETK